MFVFGLFVFQMLLKPDTCICHGALLRRWKSLFLCVKKESFVFEVNIETIYCVLSLFLFYVILFYASTVLFYSAVPVFRIEKTALGAL